MASLLLVALAWGRAFQQQAALTAEVLAPASPVLEWRSAEGSYRRRGDAMQSTSAERWEAMASPAACGPVASFDDAAAFWPYLETVYSEPLEGVVAAADVLQRLSAFNFFYYNHFPRSECIIEWLYGDAVAPNVAWRAAAMILPSRSETCDIGKDCAVSPETCMPNCPESVAGRLGFFINRHDVPMHAQRRLEVMHVFFDDSMIQGSGFEDDTTWFYHASGSGVHIDLDALRQHGSIVQGNRRELGVGGEGWVDDMMGGWMDARGIAVLILEHEAACTPMSQERMMHNSSACAEPWPVAEVVVRRQSAWPARRNTSGCVLPDAMLSTGLMSARPCACDESLAYINCAAGGGAGGGAGSGVRQETPVLNRTSWLTTSGWQIADGWAARRHMPPRLASVGVAPPGAYGAGSHLLTAMATRPLAATTVRSAQAGGGPICARHCSPLHVQPTLADDAGRAAWGRYLERVYGETGLDPQLAASFNFYYVFSPLMLGAADSSQRACVQTWSAGLGDVEAGVAWWSHPECAPSEVETPEGLVSAFGWWVNRPTAANLLSNSRLEVTHVPTDFEVSPPSHDGASSLWFYPTLGSGVYVSLDELRAMGGRLVSVADREDLLEMFPTRGFREAKDVDDNISEFMHTNGLRLVLFERALSNLGAPRAEAAGEVLKTPFASHATFASAGGSGACSWPSSAHHRAWLRAVESADAAPMRCYYEQLYGTADGAVDASSIDFFWEYAPTLDVVDALEVSAISIMSHTAHGACPMPDRSLWVLGDDVALHPARLACADVSACGCSSPTCAPRLVGGANGPSYQCAMEAAAPHPQRFPGFFVFRNDTARGGVPDDTWVEVMRMARIDDRYGGLTERPNNSSFESEMALIGQVWFWVARGSGVWLNVGRSLVLPGPRAPEFASHIQAAVELSSSPLTTNPTCREARAQGYDTIQLIGSFGLSYELIDCRGAERGDWDTTYEPACPPSHIELRAGLPTPRDAPALKGLGGGHAPCTCDHSYDFINCYGTPRSAPVADPRSSSDVSEEAVTRPAVAATTASRALNPRCTAADTARFNSLLHHYSDPARDGVFIRSLDDLADFSAPSSFYDHAVYNSTNCPTALEAAAMRPAMIPPWCPGVGDNNITGDPQHAFHFNTTLMGRYSISILSNGICWRNGAGSMNQFRSSYHLPHLKGGLLALPKNMIDRAMCFYPRDSGSVLRGNCGCGVSTEIPADGAPRRDDNFNYLAGSNCAGDRSMMRNASDAAITQYLADYFHGPNTDEECMPSLNAAAFTKVAQRQLQWDQPRSETYPGMYGPSGWWPGYNEVLVPAWFGEAHEDVPVDAWFYFGDEEREAEEINRQVMIAISRSYERVSGRRLPVLRINATECHEAPFSCS